MSYLYYQSIKEQVKERRMRSVKTDRDKFMTGEEAGRLLHRVRKRGSLRDYVLCLVGLNTGPRVGELVRLRVVDFDRAEHVVHVPTLKRLTASEKAAKRKTKESGGIWAKPRLKRGELPKLYLDVPLMDEVFVEVEKYIEADGIKDWIFPSSKDEGHLSTRQAERIFKRWAREAGLRPATSIHCFRHTRGVDLMEKGLDTTAIKEFLRHENEMSTGIYKHLLPSRREENFKKAGMIGVPDVAL